MPSIEILERRIKLKFRLDLYRRRFDEVASFQERFKSLSDEWVILLRKERELSSTLSTKDFLKLNYFETKFKSLLNAFHYRSKRIQSISISHDTFLPVVDRYSLKFDSSASDFTRAVWSFILALKETSSKFNANHPNLFILDEPGQQEAGDNDFRLLLRILGNFNDTQSIVFSSFHQSEETFLACTQDVNFSLLDLGQEKFIKYLQN